MAVRIPVGSRVFLSLVLLFAVLAAGIGLVISLTVAGTVERAVIGNVGRDTSLVAKDFETWLAEKFQILETLKVTVLKEESNPEYLLDILKRETAEEPDVLSIYYGTAGYDGQFRPVEDGLVRSSGGSYLAVGSGFTVPQGFDWTSRPWFTRAKDIDECVLSDPYVDIQTGDIVVSLSRAIRDERGKLLGVLALDMYISRLTQVVSTQKFTPTSKTYLVDARGSFITHEDKSLILQYDNPEGSIFGPSSPLRNMREAVLGSPETWDRDKAKNLYWAARRIPRTDWTIVTYGAFSDISRPITEFYSTLLWIFVAAMIVAVLFAVAEARMISTPLKQLKRGAMEMAKGNLSWEVPIKRQDEFGELGEFFNQISSSLRENMARMENQRKEIEESSKNLEKMVEERTLQLDHANKELVARNLQMEKEMQMAEAVQLKTIPQASDLPSAQELRFGARYSSVQTVGGDLYDALSLDGRRYALLIADVSGHGMAAALVAAMAKVAFRSQASLNRAPSEVCRSVNREIHELIGGETYYLSAFYLVLDVVDGSLSFSNAGHPPVLLVRKDGTMEKLDVSGGQLLGISDDFEFEQGFAHMAPGDSLLMFTDGILEARDPDGDFYEYDRLMEYVRGNRGSDPDEFIQGLMNDVDAFSRGAPRTDDRAALLVQFTEYRSPEAAHLAARGDWATRFETAGRLLRAGNARAAALLLEEIRSQRPEDPKILNMLGLACYRLGEYERAKRLLETAVALAPGSSTYRNNLERVRKKEV